MKKMNEQSRMMQHYLVKHQLIMDHTQELIFVFDKEGSVLEWNSAARKELGYEAGEEQGLYISSIFRNAFVHEENVVKLSNGFERQVKDIEEMETVAYRKNNTCFVVEIRVKFPDAEDDNGICTAIIATSLQEIKKKLKKSSDELKLVQKNKNEFVANITHELRTPLNGMIGLTKNLMEMDLDLSQKESVRIIDTCCSNMVKIISDLLDYSKMQAGMFTIEERVFCFRELMNDIIGFNMNLSNQKGLSLNVSIAKDIPDLLIGDEVRITQVLNNLIGNAIKFTSLGQIVVEVIKTIQEDEYIELFFMVTDTGIGIAEEEQDKLFKSFSQVDASITRRFGGTGLGLAICKALVEQMNGRIKVESEKGKGSTFTFSIQIKTADEKDISKDQIILSDKYKFLNENNDKQNKNSSNKDSDTTKSNLNDIMDLMEKLILCIELGTWDKAEMFSTIIKRLIAPEDKEFKRQAFRLELAVRKEDYKLSLELYHNLFEMLEML